MLLKQQPDACRSCVPVQRAQMRASSLQTAVAQAHGLCRQSMRSLYGWSICSSSYGRARPVLATLQGLLHMRRFGCHFVTSILSHVSFHGADSRYQLSSLDHSHLRDFLAPGKLTVGHQAVQQLAQSPRRACSVGMMPSLLVGLERPPALCGGQQYIRPATRRHMRRSDKVATPPPPPPF